MHATDVLKLAPLPGYREQRQHIFPSQPSLDWYLRKNRRGLVENGALLLLAGRWFVNAERFDAYLLQTGANAAKTHAASTKTDANRSKSTSMDNMDDDNCSASMLPNAKPE